MAPEELDFELEVLMELETLVYAELADQGVPTEEWEYYMAFARRLWERAVKFDWTLLTYATEKASLIYEFEERGLDPAVLATLQVHCEEMARVKLGLPPEWEEATHIMTDLHATVFVGSLLKPRYSWRWGFEKYMHYDREHRTIWLTPNKKDIHLTSILTDQLDLEHYTYTIDFRVITDRYPLEDHEAFEWGLFCMPTHYETGFITLGCDYRAAHENVITFCHHTEAADPYHNTRLSTVHHRGDDTTTTRKYTLDEIEYRKWRLRRPTWVRWVVSKSRVRLMIVGAMDAQGLLNPIRWCVGFTPRIMLRTGTNPASTKFPYRLFFDHLSISRVRIVDYTDDLPSYPTGWGGNDCDEYENGLQVVRNALWWRIKTLAGSGWCWHGDDQALVSWEVDLTALTLYGVVANKYMGSKYLTGWADFLSVDDPGSLTEHQNTLTNAITKPEKPQERQALDINTDWGFKTLTGTYELVRFPSGAGSVSSLTTFEDSLDFYLQWEMKPTTQERAFSEECWFDDGTLVSHEKNITAWVNLGEVPFMPKAKDGEVAITYG